MHGRTKGQVENITPRTAYTHVRIKQYVRWMYCVRVERVLSAIAKFLVHLIGEGEECGEMGENGGRGR